jgi:hypothetical protein
LAWKPFDLRFADILENLDNHAKVIAIEVRILEMEEASAARMDARDERQRTEEYRVGTSYPEMMHEEDSPSKSPYLTFL